MSVLRLSMNFGETSAPYNQFTLPLRTKQAITLCSYLPMTVTAPPELKVFAGNNTIPGFWRVLQQALHQQRYDIIHVHDAVVANLFLLSILLTNPRLLSSAVFTVHNSYENFKLRNRLLLLPIFALFRKVICCSKASYESFPAPYRWLAGKRLAYVQNGMDIERVDRLLIKQSRPAPTTDLFTVIAIGRLIEIKNPVALVKAFAQSKLPNGRLVFVGAGHLAESVKATAEQLGIADRVELTGLVPRDEVYQRLQAADLFVSPSYGEGLPIAVLEAMACRRPVILSDIAPHREIAGDNADLPLIHPDDIAGFAQAISRIAALPPTERAHLGQRWRKVVDDQFSLTSMHRGYAEIYAEVRPTVIPKPNTSLAR
jgi:glycosyltransferase involved in cell wall biosynthesis